MSNKTNGAGKTELIRFVVQLVFVLVIFGVTILVLYLRGQEVSLELVGGLSVLAAMIAGLVKADEYIARLLGRGGGGGTTAGALAAFVASALIASGCAANPCLAERSTVAALGVAVELANGAIPSDVDGRDEALDAARAAVQLGAGAVDGCEALRDSSGWMAWLSIGVNAIKAILELVRSVGVDLPPNVAEMLEDVEAAVEAQGG